MTSKSVLGFLLLFIFLTFSHASSIAQNLTVSGITSPASANGIYMPNGTMYDYDSWKHVSENYYIYNDDYLGSRYWNIDSNLNDGDDILFFSEQVSEAPSPVDVQSWSSHNGSGTPTVENQLVSAAPSTTTNTASSVTGSGAMLNGTVNANNSNTTVIFEYGLTTSYGATVQADQSPVTGTSDTAVSKTITGLTPNTTYHFQVVGTNANGTSNGSDLTFTTQPVSPSTTTISVSSISSSGATLHGIVNANNSSTTVIFEYGLTTSCGSALQADQSPVTGTSDTAVSKTITGLTPNTTYHFRVVGTNANGTSNGVNLTFTTLPKTAIPWLMLLLNKE